MYHVLFNPDLRDLRDLSDIFLAGRKKLTKIWRALAVTVAVQFERVRNSFLVSDIIISW